MLRSLLQSTRLKRTASSTKPNTPATRNQGYGFIQNIKVMREPLSTTPNTNPMPTLLCILRNTKVMHAAVTNKET